EKQFQKITFSKNVTPLLKARKIDFALIFALSEKQLRSILKDVIPALGESASFWVAFPKAASKIVTDLTVNCGWDCLVKEGFNPGQKVPLDHVWAAMQFCKTPYEIENYFLIIYLEPSLFFIGK